MALNSHGTRADLKKMKGCSTALCSLLSSQAGNGLVGDLFLEDPSLIPITQMAACNFNLRQRPNRSLRVLMRTH